MAKKLIGKEGDSLKDEGDMGPSVLYCDGYRQKEN